MRFEEAASGWQTVTFGDARTKQAYYRLELHALVKNEKYPGIDWRDYETMRVMSNPIWVGDLPGPVDA